MLSPESADGVARPPTSWRRAASSTRASACPTRSCGHLSQIIEENKPDGLNVVVPDVAARIDAIVAEVAFTGWRESIPGDRAVKKELRGVLKQFALPVTAEPFDPE